MASANVRLAIRVAEAFCERDLETLGGLITDDFEWVTPTPASHNPTTYRGRDGLEEFFDNAWRWEIVEGHADEVRELDDARVMVRGDLFWRARDQRLRLGGPFSSVMQFEAGKLKRMEGVTDVSKALAAGVVEA